MKARLIGAGNKVIHTGRIQYPIPDVLVLGDVGYLRRADRDETGKPNVKTYVRIHMHVLGDTWPTSGSGVFKRDDDERSD